MPDYEPTDPAREANQVSDAFFDPDCIVSAVRIPAELTANALGQPTADDTAANSGERPRVQEYRGNKFRVNDRVYISGGGGRGLRGPYLISSVPQSQTYVLCDENGTIVEGGRTLAESELQWA